MGLEDNEIVQPQDKLSNKNNDTSETVDNTTNNTATSTNVSCSPNSRKKQPQQPTLSRKLSNGLSNQIDRLTNNGNDKNGGRYIVSRTTEESDSDDLHSFEEEEGHSAKAIV